MEETEYTRLHITPFNSDVLKSILPPSILPGARNISYHSIPTFPEKGYGYVDLPIMDAEKIKKKLNGTILKGTKVRIEKARPQKAVVIEEEEPERPKRERKTKRKRDELLGVDIGERQVKRGWTTPAKDVKKDQPVVKSKYTTGPECLFKTNLPPNVASKGKTVEVKPEKKQKKPGKEALVHEFAKTTKYATFLRGSAGSNKTKTVAEFVEGKGWVDGDGNMVEEVKNSRKPKTTPVGENESIDSEEETKVDVEDHMEVDPEIEGREESSSDSSSEDEDGDKNASARPEHNQHHPMEQGSSSDSSSSDDESKSILAGQLVEATRQEDKQDSADDSSEGDSDHKGASSPTPGAVKNSAKEDSSSSDESSDAESMAEAQVQEEDSSSRSDSSKDSDSDSSDSSDAESEADSEVEEPQSAITNRSQGSTGKSLSIKIPGSLTSTPIASSVHPLEALYKRPKSDDMEPPKATESCFSFFGADGDDEDVRIETQLQVPLTPFTQKDFEYRGIRSAAPTPDTAHPNKRFVWPSENDEDEDEEAPTSSPIRNTESAKGKGKETEPESDFQKWFYENRGDVRRAWTGRRKSAAKEKRQRENRRREHRAI